MYGWLLTDGSVQGRVGQIALNLKSIDRDVLEKIKIKLEFTGTIRDRERDDGRNSSHLRICRKKMTDDLFDLGMPRADKTFNTALPNIPPYLFWDLMRGIFEGDGGIRHRTGNTDMLEITISGATSEFMDELKQELAFRGVFARKYTRPANGSSGNKRNVYTLTTKSNADALRMCYFMYSNTDEGFRLNRKFDIYRNYVNTYYDKIQRKSIPSIELVELARQTIPECSEANDTSNRSFLRLKDAA